MSFESYNKKKALALWDELFGHDPVYTIKETTHSTGPVLRTYNPKLNSAHAWFARQYFGRSRWREFYKDLLRYEADQTPWNNIRPVAK
jgi:hypothetical protein